MRHSSPLTTYASECEWSRRLKRSRSFNARWTIGAAPTHSHETTFSSTEPTPPTLRSRWRQRSGAPPVITHTASGFAHQLACLCTHLAMAKWVHSALVSSSPLVPFQGSCLTRGLLLARDATWGVSGVGQHVRLQVCWPPMPFHVSAHLHLLEDQRDDTMPAWTAPEPRLHALAEQLAVKIIVFSVTPLVSWFQPRVVI